VLMEFDNSKRKIQRINTFLRKIYMINME